MGLPSEMPFQLTAVCEGAVPRIEAVASEARPEDFTKTGLFCERISAIEVAMLLLSTSWLSGLFWVPMSRSERKPRTSTRSTLTTLRVSIFSALKTVQKRLTTKLMTNSPVITNGDLTYYVYESGESFTHYAYVYKNGNSFWMIDFIVETKSAKKYSDDILKWAGSVKFN